MSHDEIIEMAEQAGMLYMDYIRLDSMKQIEDFAKLVAAKEREACADLLEYGCIDDEGHHLQYAKEIRARGEQA
jgi:hypothetical protein